MRDGGPASEMVLDGPSRLAPVAPAISFPQPATSTFDVSVERDADQAFLADLAKQISKFPKHTSDYLLSNRDFIVHVIKGHKDGWRVLKLLTNTELRKDKDLVLIALKSSSQAWKVLVHIPESLRKDYDICLEAVKRNAAAFELLDVTMRDNGDLHSEALATFKRKMEAKTREQQLAQDWDSINQQSKEKLRKGRPSISQEQGSEPKQAFPEIQSPAAAKDKNRKPKTQTMTEQQEWCDRLQEEIDNGNGKTRTANATQTFTRVVPLVTLRVTKNDGCMLVILGERKNGKMTIDASLPGGRMKDGEHPLDAVTRIMAKKLGTFSKHITIEPEFSVVVEEGKSLSVAQQTRYLKCVFNAKLDHKFKWTRDIFFIPSSFRRYSQRGKTTSLSRRFMGGLMNPLAPDMFVFSKDEKEMNFFGWLTTFEYEWLRYTDTGKATLSQWMASVPHNLELESLLSPSTPNSPRTPREQEVARKTAHFSTFPAALRLGETEIQAADSRHVVGLHALPAKTARAETKHRSSVFALPQVPLTARATISKRPDDTTLPKISFAEI